MKNLWINNLSHIRIEIFFRWFDLWIGVYINVPAGRAYICPLPTLGLIIDFYDTSWFRNWWYEDFGSYDDDDDTSEHWLCECGNYIENGLHCPQCHCEPSWGCPCSFCQGGEDQYEPDYEFDPYDAGFEVVETGHWDQEYDDLP